MIIVGALALLYAFCYATGSLAELGQTIEVAAGRRISMFESTGDKYDAMFYDDIKWFNDLLMYIGIISILLGVLLYITACNSRRNYYISNYVAIGVTAGGNIAMSLVAIILNAIWKAKFLNVDFEAWKKFWDDFANMYPDPSQVVTHYADSTVWFDIGFAVYAILIVASVVLLLNLVWKIKLMQGEKKLLEGSVALTGGVA